jgi:aspartyl-tRNA(Asn)/glutamyl-tRNA(Gln) amidotransferase subunit C
MAVVSAITRAEVAHLARLSRLALTTQELDRFAGQLDVILGAVARVQEVAAAGQAAGTGTERVNVFRADSVMPPLSQQAVLDQAPAAANGRFRVPRFLGED